MRLDFFRFYHLSIAWFLWVFCSLSTKMFNFFFLDRVMSTYTSKWLPLKHQPNFTDVKTVSMVYNHAMIYNHVYSDQSRILLSKDPRFRNQCIIYANALISTLSDCSVNVMLLAWTISGFLVRSLYVKVIYARTHAQRKTI